MAVTITRRFHNTFVASSLHTVFMEMSFAA